MKLSRKKIRERFAGHDIIFRPKIGDMQIMDIAITTDGEIGFVSDLAYPGKRMWNSASGFHSVVLDFRRELTCSWCYRITDIYCVIKDPKNDFSINSTPQLQKAS